MLMFFCILLIIACILTIVINGVIIVEEGFELFRLWLIVGSTLTFFSIFIVSNYYLEYNIKNHTYIVKGLVSNCDNTDIITIDHNNYTFEPKYMTDPFMKTSILDKDKVEIVTVDSIFFRYIVKVNKVEK